MKPITKTKQLRKTWYKTNNSAWPKTNCLMRWLSLETLWMVRNRTNEMNLNGKPWTFSGIEVGNSLAILMKKIHAEHLKAPLELLSGGVLYTDYWGLIEMFKWCAFLLEGSKGSLRFWITKYIDGFLSSEPGHILKMSSLFLRGRDRNLIFHSFNHEFVIQTCSAWDSKEGL